MSLKGEILRIGTRDYSKEYPGVFRVRLSELGDFRTCELNPHSTVEIADLPTGDDYEIEMNCTNGGDDHLKHVHIFVYVSYRGATDAFEERGARIYRTFLPLVEQGILADLRVERAKDRVIGSSWTDVSGRTDVVLGSVAGKVAEALKKLLGPPVRLFVCHATEDKPFARELASFLHQHGAEVWFDQWEIKVGDSIVQKVNDGLQNATHLAVLLSPHSVAKPWVRKEFSSALMRQLADNSVMVLPVLVGDCEIPAILRDIRYADCRKDPAKGFTEMVTAILPPPSILRPDGMTTTPLPPTISIQRTVSPSSYS